MSVKLLTYHEHANIPLEVSDSINLKQEDYTAFFKKKRGEDLPCYTLKQNGFDQYSLTTSYFIGVDWIEPGNTALYIVPKLNREEKEIDFISMLFSSLKHTEVFTEIEELFEIKWEQPSIHINQKQDILTPFLIVEYLSLLKNIVRKGLKKSYYNVERNLHSRVKGKMIVGKSIKKNISQNKNLFTYCSYQEFGVNTKENRLLKKALVFIKRYLSTYTELTDHIELQDTFNYINPSFHQVSDDIELYEIKNTKTNSFYKEYEQAIRLAKLILRRFGYNISNTVQDRINTPPFWIDMSKLFELYVLGLLKDRFHHQVTFQFKYYGNELDYLLKTEDYKMVIDAKYKDLYANGHDNQDIRQVSGYARLKKVYDTLEIDYNKNIDTLIIYPDQEHGEGNLLIIDLKKNKIPSYINIFKIGIKLPTVD